jgi:DNA-binding XRE family transcriptional regulator
MLAKRLACSLVLFFGKKASITVIDNLSSSESNAVISHPVAARAVKKRFESHLAWGSIGPKPTGRRLGFVVVTRDAGIGFPHLLRPLDCGLITCAWQKDSSTIIVINGGGVCPYNRYTSDMILTPAQCRAARGLAAWSQDQLAKRANVGNSTVRDFEKGRRVPLDENLAAIVTAFEKAGVIFESDGKFVGVKLKIKRGK